MRRAIVIAILVVGCAALAGCLGPVRGVYPPAASDRGATIFVTSNGWHTSLVVRSKDLPESLRQKLSEFARYPWLEIGWGEEGFYRAKEITVGLALRAAVASRGSVIHVRRLEIDPAAFFADYDVSLLRVRVSQEGIRRLAGWIEASIVPDEHGLALDGGPGQDLDCRFVMARGDYSVLHTCNHWTADALRRAGLPITPVYCFTAGNVEFQLRQRLRRFEGEVRVQRRGRETISD